MKQIKPWLWSFICIFLFGFFLWLLNEEDVYTGNDINVEVGSYNYIVIDAVEPVTLEAASESFFVLRDPEGKVFVIGKPALPPLGWQSDAYFKAEAQVVPADKLLVEQGSAVTVHFTSETSMTMEVVLKQESKIFLVVFLFLMIFLIWLLGLWVLL